MISVYAVFMNNCQNDYVVIFLASMLNRSIDLSLVINLQMVISLHKF